MSPKVCSACQDMFQAWYNGGGEDFISDYPHNITTLEIGANAACHLCTLLIGELEMLDIPIATLQGKHLTTYFWKRRSGMSEDTDTLVLRISDSPSSKTTAYTNPLLIRKLSRYYMPESWWVPVSPTLLIHLLGQYETVNAADLPFTTNSDNNWAISRGWFEKCLETHKCCGSRVPTRLPLPTRLVRIGTSNLHLQLCLSKDLPEDTTYATLSHCWGAVTILMLQKENIVQFQQRLHFDDLCKTFQDFLVSARHFGLEYIWIDSLCIIQNDEDDWRRESSSMAQVYGGSTLNIAAAAASDGRAGLFPSRNPLSIQRCRIHVQSQSPDNKPGDIFEMTRTGIYNRCVSAAPLGRRAWALQERFLAPRTLHFGTEMLWECREEILCETFSETMSQLHCGLYSVAVNKGELHANAAADLEQLRSLSDAIIEEYTSSALTRPSDKLVALSGVARWTHDRMGFTYVCGLWKELLHHQLLWWVRKPKRRLTGYRAPSWSWAAVDGACSFDKSLWPLPSSIRIVDFQVLNVDSDPYGQVLHGSIRLACTQLFRWPWRTGGLEKCGTQDDRATFWPDRDPELWSFDRLSQSCFCLSFYDSNVKTDSMLGFVLECTSQRGQFCRVGLFEATGCGGEPVALETAQLAIPDELLYEGLAAFETQGRGKHIISIV